MRVLRGRVRKLVACAAAGFFAECTASSNTNTEGVGPDSSDEADVSLVDETSVPTPSGTDAATLDATDAIGAVVTTEASPTEHVVPDGVYDCDVVMGRCNGSDPCFTPALGIFDGGVDPSGNGVLASFEMTLSGNTVVISPGYSCTGTWYAAGDPIDVLPFVNGAAPGGFVCLLDQPIYHCHGSWGPCPSLPPPYFVIYPTDPITTRNNADGGALQPGEIYAGLSYSSAYSTHCAPKH